MYSLPENLYAVCVFCDRDPVVRGTVDVARDESSAAAGSAEGESVGLRRSGRRERVVAAFRFLLIRSSRANTESRNSK